MKNRKETISDITTIWFFDNTRDSISFETKDVLVLEKDYQVGDYAYLKRPELGYRYVDIIGLDGERLLVRTTNGLEFTVYPDELEN